MGLLFIRNNNIKKFIIFISLFIVSFAFAEGPTSGTITITSSEQSGEVQVSVSQGLLITVNLSTEIYYTGFGGTYWDTAYLKVKLIRIFDNSVRFEKNYVAGTYTDDVYLPPGGYILRWEKHHTYEGNPIIEYGGTTITSASISYYED